MLRAHLPHSLRKRRDQSVTVSHSTGIRLEGIVIREIVQAKSPSTRAPLIVAPYGDDERTVGSIEQLVRDEIGMSISPPRCIRARDEDVLCDVHERRASAVRERD